MSQSEIQNPKSKIVISSRDDADRCLQRIAALERFIADAEKDADEEIAEIRSRLVDETAVQRFALEQNIKALERWATDNKSALFTEPRRLELNFGTVGFRWTPYKIVAIGKLKVETILERIKAAKLTQLIRTKEEIDREKALNYSPEDLARCGLKKTRKDEFYYECKKEELAR